MLLSQSKRTVWANLTIIFNRHHCVKKTILFDQTAVNNAFVRVLRWCVLQWISLLLLCVLGGRSLSRGVRLVLHLDIDVVAVALERSNQTIVLVLVQRVHIAELFEYKVVR